MIDQRGHVDEFAIDLAAERGLRETGPDRRGHFGHRHRMIVLPNRAVGQSYRNHCVLLAPCHLPFSKGRESGPKKNAAPSRAAFQVSHKTKGRNRSSTSVDPKGFRPTFAVS